MEGTVQNRHQAKQHLAKDSNHEHSKGRKDGETAAGRVWEQQSKLEERGGKERSSCHVLETKQKTWMTLQSQQLAEWGSLALWRTEPTPFPVTQESNDGSWKSLRATPKNKKGRKTTDMLQFQWGCGTGVEDGRIMKVLISPSLKTAKQAVPHFTACKEKKTYKNKPDQIKLQWKWTLHFPV